MGSDSQSKDPRPVGVLDRGTLFIIMGILSLVREENPVISKRRNSTSQKNKIVMECYLLSEPKIRGYRKCMLSLWLQKGLFWVAEQILFVGIGG